MRWLLRCIKEIAEAIGVSKSTLYMYLKEKMLI
ncbi:ArsR family transcriptional regulator [Clostridium paraputrificum]